MIRIDDVVSLAEQATLGGLLLEPVHFAQVDTWVRGQDFTDPWHRLVWAALREARAEGRTLNAEGLAADLLRRHGARIADIVRIDDLLAAVPPDPDARPHARVVVEFGVRREIAGQGVLLEAAALSAALHLEARPMQAATRVVAAAFLIAGERWGQANGETVRHLADHLPTQLKASASSLELRRTADKFLTQAPAPDAGVTRANEARLVACLASHPTAIRPTLEWLGPDRLTNKPWRTVYLALEDLAERGQPIDAVSLATAVLRTSRATGTAPDLGELRDAVAGEQASVPGYLRRIVAADQVRLLARAGARALRLGAANPGHQVVDLLETGALLVQGLRDLVAVMPDAAGQPTGPRPGLDEAATRHQEPGQQHGRSVAG
jgi:replicative DNA helicase